MILLSKIVLAVLILFSGPNVFAKTHTIYSKEELKKICESGTLKRGQDDALLHSCHAYGFCLPCSNPQYIVCTDANNVAINDSNLYCAAFCENELSWDNYTCAPRGYDSESDLCNAVYSSQCNGQCTGANAPEDICFSPQN